MDYCLMIIEEEFERSGLRVEGVVEMVMECSLKLFAIQHEFCEKYAICIIFA